MIETYCILITSLILAMTAGAYLRGRCEHVFTREGPYFPADVDWYYIRQQCKKCRRLEIRKYSKSYP